MSNVCIPMFMLKDIATRKLTTKSFIQPTFYSAELLACSHNWLFHYMEWLQVSGKMEGL